MINKKMEAHQYIYLIVDKHINIAKASTVPIATAKRKAVETEGSR
jgi:hypothetical protein